MESDECETFLSHSNKYLLEAINRQNEKHYVFFAFQQQLNSTFNKWSSVVNDSIRQRGGSIKWATFYPSQSLRWQLTQSGGNGTFSENRMAHGKQPMCKITETSHSSGLYRILYVFGAWTNFLFGFTCFGLKILF